MQIAPKKGGVATHCGRLVADGTSAPRPRLYLYLSSLRQSHRGVAKPSSGRNQGSRNEALAARLLSDVLDTLAISDVDRGRIIRSSIVSRRVSLCE